MKRERAKKNSTHSSVCGKFGKRQTYNNNWENNFFCVIKNLNSNYSSLFTTQNNTLQSPSLHDTSRDLFFEIGIFIVTVGVDTRDEKIEEFFFTQSIHQKQYFVTCNFMCVFADFDSEIFPIFLFIIFTTLLRCSQWNFILSE